jgi:heme/copper-type cytochrome/quinol oxidase subunit 1
MTTGEDSTDRSALRHWRRLLIPVLAAAASAAGIAAVLAPRQDTGWFAYAPLANQTFTSGQIVLMDSGARAGYLLMAAGLLTLAFWWGYRLGVRRKDG